MILSAITRFFFPRKLERLSYFFRFCLISFVEYWIIFNLTIEEPSVAVLYLAILAYFFFYCVFPRARDCCFSFWFLILFFIPMANVLPVVILFCKGSRRAASDFALPEEGSLTSSASL